MNGQRARQFAAVCLTLNLLTGGCTSQQPALPQVIAKVHNSVVGLSDGRSALGTGFVIANGLIVSNAHLVGSDPILVKLNDGRELLATVTETDQTADLALLKVATGDLQPLPLRQDAPLVGETVIALGNPFGLGITASHGIISAQGRAISKAQRLQTDAAINPGNSGGPLIDTQGRVVGIVSSRAAVGTGVGFAVTVPALQQLLNREN